MFTRRRQYGFTLVEVLLVLAILGILSGIAIPSYLGQRKRARVIGQAQTDANILAMQLETVRADAGVFGSTATGKVPGTSTFLPQFKPSGAMTYKIDITNNGMGYLITASEGGKKLLTQDHMGTVIKEK